MPAPTEVMRKLAQERSKDGKPVSDAQAQGHWIRGTAQGNGLILGSGDYGPVVAFDPKTNETIVRLQIVFLSRGRRRRTFLTFVPSSQLL